MTKGSDFEKLSEQFLKYIFNKSGFVVVEIRRQKSGTQYGFDLLVKFGDESDITRSIHFECKDYRTDLKWHQIRDKIDQLGASSYIPDGFVALSPQKNISNVVHHTLQDLEKKNKFPIELWTPDTFINELFSINEEIYKKIYNEECPKDIDEDLIVNRFKICINSILQRKIILKTIAKITIKESDREPNEEKNRKSTLDEKLDSIFDKDDPDRIEYHKIRCDYKVYLEDLEGIDPDLRQTILRWQIQLRQKAKLLTKKFQLYQEYTSSQFFFEFFEEAEKVLITFVNIEKISGDLVKLLHGIVFELAAECPLDWR